MSANPADNFHNPQLQNVELIVFDLDGTLVDAFADITAAVNHMLRQFGRPELDIEEVKPHVGNGAKALVAGVLDTIDQDLIERGLSHLMDHYHKNPTNHAVLYDDAIETLQELQRRGIRMAVASNKPDALTRKVLEDVGICDYFCRVAGESSAFPRKPAGDLLEDIIHETGISRESTIVVGDSCVDIEFARAGQVRVVAVSHGQTSVDELCQNSPDALIHSLPELLELLS